MGKIPYLFRRKNVFYFRLIIPKEQHSSLDFKQITLSLRTQDKERAIPHALKLASHFKIFLQDLKAGKTGKLSRSELIANLSDSVNLQIVNTEPVTPQHSLITPSQKAKPQSPLLSVVVGDFLCRYDRNNKAMLKKLNTALPVFIELIGDKPVKEILQTDINKYFDDVQRLPKRGNDAVFKGMTYGAVGCRAKIDQPYRLKFD